MISIFPLAARLRSALLMLALAPAALAASDNAPRLYLVAFDAPAVLERSDALPVAKLAAPARIARYQQMARLVGQGQMEVRERLEQALGRPLAARYIYQYGINGMALALSGDELDRVRRTAGVSHVQLDWEEQMHTDAGPRWIGAEAFWNGSPDVAAGKRGEGAVVGVIDSGINASHPAFADRAVDGYDHINPRDQRFGFCVSGPLPGRCNDKLIGIYDFTAEGSRDGSDTTGHGTHVASIAVGNPFVTAPNASAYGLELTLSGVAPRANLISYKACAVDSCQASALVAALDQAIADGVDVINYSLGSGARSPWQDLSHGFDMRSMLNARAAGILVVASAGNLGPDPGTIVSPGNAPWVLSVANTTHDRVFQTTLTELSGSSAPPRGTFIGRSLSGGMSSTAPIVLGQGRGSALCSTGNSLDDPPTGASNPFLPGSLANLIVVCDRGIHARVAKSNNVRLAGGAGMVLANTDAANEEVIADTHSLPAVHLGYSDSESLKQWLRSTGNARGRITATAIVRDPAVADLLDSVSGRGPDPTDAGVSKPNLSAPGDGILAADHLSNGARNKSGTSMSTPHVAGAAALLKSAHPDWRAAQLHSALVLTAEASQLRNMDRTPAGINDGGAGRTQVQRATRAELYFPLDRAGFEAGNPRQGGDPCSMNLPELYSPGCGGRLTFARTVEGLSHQSWTVSVEVPPELAATVTPASFTLAPRQRQNLNFAFRLTSGAALGRLLSGRVRLVPASAGAEVLTMPVQIQVDFGNLPTRQVVQLQGDRGVATFNLDAQVAVDGLHYQLLGPAAARLMNPALGADTGDAGNAFDGSGGTHLQILTPGETDSAILARIESSQGDVDLYVGHDRDGDGNADVDELVCARFSVASQEECVLNGLQTAPRRYWVLVHNPSAMTRTVAIEVVSLGPSQARASGPARTQAGSSLPIRLALDVAGQGSGPQLGLVQLFGTFDASAPFAQIELQVDRIAAAAPAASQLLSAETEERFNLAAGASADLGFMDDPGDGVQRQLSISRNGAIQLRVLAAPEGGFAATAPTDGALVAELGADQTGTTLSLAGSTTPRRLFLRATNTTGQLAELSARVVEPPARFLANGTRTGMYYNPARGGHGLFLTRARNDLQVAWYTYDHNGRPTFFLGFAADAFSTGQTGLRAQSVVPLSRYTWDGARARGQLAGFGLLTSLGPDRFQWSWTVDETSSSEPMELLAANSCVSPAPNSQDFTGLWFNPALPGYGASVFSRPDLEIQAVYLYDQQGLPRWLWNDSTPFGQATTPLLQYQGFCPGCTFMPVSRTAVGNLTRSYPNGPGESGSWRVQAQFTGGLSGSWDTSGPLLALTETAVCP